MRCPGEAYRAVDFPDVRSRYRSLVRSKGARLGFVATADRDAIIAATALVHGMTIVTRNIADFESTEVAVINPWA